jgi:myo-inositol 2-dehydrogenase/D-chiro-inositol 1-dehydrogenase
VLLLRNDNDTLTVLDVFVNARCGYDVRCEVIGAAGAISLADNQPSPLASAEDGRAATAVAAALIESMSDHGAPVAGNNPRR